VDEINNSAIEMTSNEINIVAVCGLVHRARRSAKCPLRFAYRSRDSRGQTTSRTLTGLTVVFANLVRLSDEPVLP
jgi:hypothetical protein